MSLGGRTETADTIIEHLEKYYSGFSVDHMVLSHAENDQACGLIEPSFDAYNWLMLLSWTI